MKKTSLVLSVVFLILLSFYFIKISESYPEYFLYNGCRIKILSEKDINNLPLNAQMKDLDKFGDPFPSTILVTTYPKQLKGMVYSEENWEQVWRFGYWVFYSDNDLSKHVINPKIDFIASRKTLIKGPQDDLPMVFGGAAGMTVDWPPDLKGKKIEELQR